MKKVLTIAALFAATLAANAQYQVANSDFETWEDVSYNKKTGQEPVSWNSFLTGTGGLKSMAANNQVESSEDVRPGSTGSKSAKITAKKVAGVIAQGNLTTGCINMGSTTAGNAGASMAENNKLRGSENIFKQSGNYNFTNLEGEGLNQKFTGLPDAVHVWVKFVGGTEANPYAKVAAILHTDGYYQDPLPKTDDCTGRPVQIASNSEIASSEEWQELTIPFGNELLEETRPAYALVSFSTNNTPGKGTENDVMYIDDFEFVYNSELTSFKYDGAEIFENGALKDMSDVVYDAAKVGEMLSNGRAAVISHEYDEATLTLTVTVKGDNYSEDATNVHTYTTTFKAPLVPALTEVKFGEESYEVGEGDVNIDAIYSAEKVSFVSNDENATFASKYDAATGRLAVTMTDCNGDTHTYGVQFRLPALTEVKFGETSYAVSEGDVNIDAVYSSAKISFVSNDEGAAFTSAYDAATGRLAVTMTGSDSEESVHIYGVQFQAPVSSVTFSEDITVSINDNEPGSFPADIILYTMSDGTYVVALNEFSMGEGAAVGNIVVEGLNMTTADGINTFSHVERDITISAGSKEGESYLGPDLGIVPIVMDAETLGDEKMHTTINIDFMGFMQIAVSFGKDIVAVNETAAVTEEGDAHVVLNRAFKAGWNPVCLPFATTAEQLGGAAAEAQEFESFDGTVLYFKKVEKLEAGKPYLLWCKEDVAAGQVLTDVVLDPSAPVSVVNGDVTFEGAYAPVEESEKNYTIGLDGDILLLLPNAEQVMGTHARFFYTGTEVPADMPIQLEGGKDVTGIQAVGAETGNATVYDLSGRRVKQAVNGGIYVVNGKKVIK